MVPNHRFRKNLLLIGGSSELGRAVTKRFAKTLLYRWNVFNVDAKPNPDAAKNFIVDSDSQTPFTGEVLDNLRTQVGSFNTEYDAMINLTGVGQQPAQLSLKSESSSLFEEWDKLRRTEVQTSLLLAHLAANYLSPTGYVCFSSDLSVFNPTTSFKGPVLNQIVKAMIQK